MVVVPKAVTKMLGAKKGCTLDLISDVELLLIVGKWWCLLSNLEPSDKISKLLLGSLTLITISTFLENQQVALVLECIWLHQALGNIFLKIH